MKYQQALSRRKTRVPLSRGAKTREKISGSNHEERKMVAHFNRSFSFWPWRKVLKI